jgi:Fe-S cluster biogenesis protein NfuA
MLVLDVQKIFNLMEEKRKLISEILNSLKPAMEVDGGGIEEFIIQEDNVLKVKFRGTCVFCPSQNLTLTHGIKKTVMSKIDWVLDVISYK